MLINFNNAFTEKLSAELLVIWYLKVPSFVQHDATLPCNMFVRKTRRDPELS